MISTCVTPRTPARPKISSFLVLNDEGFDSRHSPPNKVTRSNSTKRSRNFGTPTEKGCRSTIAVREPVGLLSRWRAFYGHGHVSIHLAGVRDPGGNVTASAARQSPTVDKRRLLRRFTPRNDTVSWARPQVTEEIDRHAFFTGHLLRPRAF